MTGTPSSSGCCCGVLSCGAVMLACAPVCESRQAGAAAGGVMVLELGLRLLLLLVLLLLLLLHAMPSAEGVAFLVPVR
jgi:hypothetical protein